jgi:hypothetical protein
MSQTETKSLVGDPGATNITECYLPSLSLNIFFLEATAVTAPFFSPGFYILVSIPSYLNPF